MDGEGELTGLTAERFKDIAEIVPVRGLHLYRMGNAVTRLVEEEECSVIFVDDNNDYENHLVEAAKRYPEVTFVTPASNVFDTLPNVRTFGINSRGWNYLIGIAADYSGGGSVYDFILHRHRALAEGKFRPDLDRFKGFHPGIRKVLLPETD